MDKNYSILDIDALKQKMYLKNISSIRELSTIAGVHRNSLTPYLKGEKSIFSSVFEKLCSTLEVAPGELIKSNNLIDRYEVFPLLRKLWEKESYQDLSCFLFGSRAAGLEKQFSDYDIGLGRGLAPIDPLDFLDIKENILLAAEDLPVSIDVVDFDNAPNWFLSDLGEKFISICGSQVAYHQLQGKIYGIKKTSATKEIA